MKKTIIKAGLLLIIATVFFPSCNTDDDPANVKACFSFSPEENIRVGDTIYFSNCSQEATEYLWDFGDSQASTEVEPYHVFTSPGNYEISLIAMNNGIQDEAVETINILSDLGYIINAGNWSGDKSTITAYDKYTDQVINGYYKSVNSVDIVSNIQFAYHYNENIYLLGNEVDEVFFVDAKTFVQTKNSITDEIVGPRYCQGDGEFLYVSCWGGNVWADPTVSYIAKIDLSTNSVVKKIPLAGGPEGLAIANNKLYAALNYKDSIAVMDLVTESITYIDLPAGNIPSYFLKDNDNNLYVNLGRSLSDYTTQTGLGYINTTTDELDAVYALDGISSSSYVNVMSANSDFSKIYVMTSGFDSYWNIQGGIETFDVSSKTFESNAFISDVSGINGIGFYNDKVIAFIAPNVTGNGKMAAYNLDGTLHKEYETGIAPFMLLAVN